MYILSIMQARDAQNYQVEQQLFVPPSFRTGCFQVRAALIRGKLETLPLQLYLQGAQQKPDAIQKCPTNKANNWKVVIFNHNSATAVS